MNASLEQSTHVTPALGQIVRAGAIAAMAGAAINAAIWFVASILGPVTIPLLPVIFVSILGVAIGGVIYAILTRLTRRANIIFIIIAVTFLILYAFMPLNAMNTPPMPGMPTFTPLTVAATELMHIVSGVLAIVFYTRTSRA